MSIEKIGETKGYATSLLGGFNKPEAGGITSGIRGRDEDRIGDLLASGNIKAPAPASNSF